MRESEPSFNPGLINDWVSMWNSYDLSLVEKLFLNDSKLTYFSSERQDIIRGIRELHTHHEGFGFVRGGKVQPNRLWMENVQTDVFPGAPIVKAI